MATLICFLERLGFSYWGVTVRLLRHSTTLLFSSAISPKRHRFLPPKAKGIRCGKKALHGRLPLYGFLEGQGLFYRGGGGYGQFVTRSLCSPSQMSGVGSCLRRQMVFVAVKTCCMATFLALWGFLEGGGYFIGRGGGSGYGQFGIPPRCVPPPRMNGIGSCLPRQMVFVAVKKCCMNTFVWFPGRGGVILLGGRGDTVLVVTPSPCVPRPRMNRLGSIGRPGESSSYYSACRFPVVNSCHTRI